MPTLEIPIISGLDDADENIDQDSFNLNNSSQVQAISSFSTSARRTCGLRFQNVQLPQGCTITAARLSISITSTTFDDASIFIAGEDIDDSENFSDNPTIMTRTKTSASVSWSQTNIGDGYSNTPDFTSVVQEIVNRAGWSKGNSLTIFLQGRDNINRNLWLRPHEFDSASSVAILIVSYLGMATPLSYNNVADSFGIISMPGRLI